jgi:hypothetical protein
MIMDRLFIVCFLLLGTLSAFSAEDENDQLSGFYPNKYTGYLDMEIGSKTEISGGVNGLGSGLYIECGFNLGKFINQYLIIAPYAGISPIFGADYSSEFRDALKKYHQVTSRYAELNSKTGLTDEESKELNAITAGEVIAQTMMTNKLQGSFSTYYGIMLRLPFKYSPILKLYRSWQSIEISSGSRRTTGGNYIGTGSFMSSYGWGGELIFFRGYTFGSDRNFGQLNIGSAGIYCEIDDLYNADFGTYSQTDPQIMYFRNYVSKDFFTGFNDIKFGIKLGLNLF